MEKVRNFLSFNSAPGYTITGTYSYYLEVSIKGDSPYQTSTVSITAFAKSDKKIAIAISCKWYRVHEDRQYRLATIHSNTYQLSAEDLGYTLKVEVTPQEEDHNGTAVVQYGPVRLDPNVRNTLESILGAGGSRFPIQLVDEETGAMSKEPAALSMTSEFVRIVETPPVGKEKELKFKYSYDLPKIELNYLDCTRMYFMFVGDEEDSDAVKKFINGKKNGPHKLGMKFLSRTARDLVILALKSFATKNYLVNSMMINEVVFTPGKIFRDKKDNPQKIGDMLLEVDSIKREMYLVLERNQELGKDKERLQQNLKGLEQELSSTIDTYGQLLNEVRSNVDTSQSTDSAGEYKKKTENLQDEVRKLKRRIQEMEEERLYTEKNSSPKRKSVRPDEKGLKNSGKENYDLDRMKQDFESLPSLRDPRKEDPNLFSLEYEMKLHDLEDENQKLKSKNESLYDEIRQIKERGSVTSHPLESVRAKAGRPTVQDESFFVIENKINDTKKLNELLIKQVNDQKAKNKSLQKELDLLRDEVSKFRDSDHLSQEELLREDLQKLEKEILKLKHENSNLQQKASAADSMSNSFISQQQKSIDESSQFKKRIEDLQRENNELKGRITGLEKAPIQGFGAGDNSMILNTSIRSIPGTPNKREGVHKVDEEFSVRFKSEMDHLAKDVMNWKAKCSGFELELEKLKKENNDLKKKEGHTSFGSPATKGDMMSYLDRSMPSSSRTYEVLLSDAKRENDKLYGEVIALKTRASVAEYSLQTAKAEMERLRSIGSGQSGLENEMFKTKKESEILKDVNEKLKNELKSLRARLTQQMSPQEKDNILKERDQLRAEVESLKNSPPPVVNTTAEKSSREIQILKSELESYKAKNNSLLKEIEYLRNEVNTLRRKDESMLNMSGLLGSDEYKNKYEKLQEEYVKLQKEFNQLKAKHIDNSEELHQMNELLRKEVLEYQKKVEELEQNRKSVRAADNFNEEELKKRNRMLEVEVQNQRERIADLEKENERYKFAASLKVESTNDESFIAKDRDEIEKLRNENENLLQQRNQLSKKVESLAKELESKTGMKVNQTNQAKLDSLISTNDKLLQENFRLMEENRELREELDTVRSSSRLNMSRYDDGDTDRYRDLQHEISMVRQEKDQLFVELSKMKAMEKNKRFIF